MRIISGDLKGKKIKYIKSDKTRPLRDFVKENIFNVIQHSNLIDVQIKGSEILDLFSGIGSFGFECISRKAKKVVFLENDKSAKLTLQKNIEILSVKNKVEVVDQDVFTYLNIKGEIKYDIIFLDPPYAHQELIKCLDLIKEFKFLKKKHLIIIHRESSNSEEFDKKFHKIFYKKYGRSKIYFGSFI